MSTNIKIQLPKIVNILCLVSTLLLFTQFAFYFGKVQRYIYYIFFLTYILDFLVDKRWKNLVMLGKKQRIFYISLLLFFLLQFIYYPVEQATEFFSKIFEHRLPFLAIGIIGFLGFNRYFKLKYFAWTILITSLLLCSFLLSKVDKQMLLNPDRNELIGIIRVKYIGSHMIFNFFLNTTLILIYYLHNQLHNLKSKWQIFQKIILGFSVVLIFATLLLSEGRLGLLVGFIVVLIIVSLTSWKRNKIVSILGLSLLLIGSVFILSKNPRLNPNYIKSDPRFVIWNLAKHEIRRTHFLGEGASTAAENFKKLLSTSPEIKNFDCEVLSKAFTNKDILGAHAHNQFLQTSMEYGIFGFGLLIFICVFPFFVVSKVFRPYMFLFLLISITQLCTDIFVSGLIPLFFLLMIALLIKESHKESGVEELAIQK